MQAEYSTRGACMLASEAVAFDRPAGQITHTPARARLVCLCLIAALLVATALILLNMGRVGMCKCGTIKLWHGVVQSSENSQHISDWYTLSHIVHGFLFYFAAWMIARLFKLHVPFFLALLAAVAVEATWEIFENTDFIINRYREATISLDYFGDSVINSISDILAMIIGFMIARAIPVAASLVTVLVLEGFALWMIRDNLLLNIIMLVHPLDVIKTWQNGG